MKTKKVKYLCEEPLSKYGIDFRKNEVKEVPAHYDFSSKCFEELTGNSKSKSSSNSEDNS